MAPDRSLDVWAEPPVARPYRDASGENAITLVDKAQPPSRRPPLHTELLCRQLRRVELTSHLDGIGVGAPPTERGERYERGRMPIPPGGRA